jgi:metal-responsive CopG/Arc/MetJ family transcriptional regulator
MTENPVGRPPLDDDAATIRPKVSMSERMWEQLAEAARESGVTTSAYVREACAMYLAKRRDMNKGKLGI